MLSDKQALAAVKQMTPEQLAKIVLDLDGFTQAEQLVLLVLKWVQDGPYGTRSLQVYTGYKGAVDIFVRRTNTKGEDFNVSITIDPNQDEETNMARFKDLFSFVITGVKDRHACFHCFAKGCKECDGTGWADPGAADFGLNEQGEDGS